MNEDIIALYQQALGLLRLRTGENIVLNGEFENTDDGKTRYVLTRISKNGGLSKTRFKPMENATKALEYFIKTSQNLFNV